ncbi:hypothetical protein L950_0219780 [Sphingobacterium sp. IITKGP-BTPF85]|nr:hypothetical protein L950_0219780 [Sphingobacterium sp. IITKGP-BTPF85]
MNTEKIARIFFKYKEPSRGLINFLDEYTEIIHYPKKPNYSKKDKSVNTFILFFRAPFEFTLTINREIIKPQAYYLKMIWFYLYLVFLAINHL